MKKKKKKTQEDSNFHFRSIFEEEVDDQLDLHGCAIDEAMYLTEEFIIGAYGAKYNKVRLIHGGSLSFNEESIKGELKKTLGRKLKKYINSFRYEINNGGATIVNLASK